MFAYCIDNPITRMEIDGESSAAVIMAGLVGGFFNAMSALSSGGGLDDAIWSFGIGFGFGVMGAAIEGAALLKAAVSGVIGVVNSISVQLKTQGAVSFTSTAVAFGSYFLGSGLSGKLFEMFIDDVLQEGMGV